VGKRPGADVLTGPLPGAGGVTVVMIRSGGETRCGVRVTPNITESPPDAEQIIVRIS
jgi:hypothetical protein